MDGAGALPTIDNDTIALFQRNQPGASSAAISIIGHAGGESILKLGDTDDEDIGRIRYQHTDNSMDFYTNNTQQMSIGASGNITASANISASGTITAAAANITTITATHGEFTTINTSQITSSIVTASVIYSSGSNIFGDATDDTHLFNGHITASGNLSSSGLVYSNESMIGGIHLRNHAGNLNLPGAGLRIANDSIFDANIIAANITASGNISASDMVRATSFEARGSSAFGYMAAYPIPATVMVGGNMKVTSHITASGHISGSGTTLITAQDLHLDRELTVPTIANVNTTHVTASGNISSSGTVSAESIFGSGYYLGGNLGNKYFAREAAGIATIAVGGGGITNLLIDAPVTASIVSASSHVNTAELQALVLHGKHKGFAQNNSGGVVNTEMTEAVYPGGSIVAVTQTTSNNAVTYTLPAPTMGLEYTFIATQTSTGSGTTTISAATAVLKGLAICTDASEIITGTNFIFASTKFKEGTRVTCISDGTLWHITAICTGVVGDVSTT